MRLLRETAAQVEGVQKADQELESQGGCARFGWDDGYLIGPPDVTYATLETFSREVHDNCGLTLQRSKTEVFNRSDNTTPRNGLVSAGAKVNGQWEPGMLCYGVPIGTDKYVQYMLNLKVTEIEQELEEITGPQGRKTSSQF